MSSRPRIYKVWGHRGAEPTLCFIILKDKVGNDTSAENHWPPLPKTTGHLCRKPLAKSPLLGLPKNFKPISVQSRTAIGRYLVFLGH